MGGAPVDKDGSRVLGSTYQNTKGVHLMVTASLLHPNIGESQMLVGPTGSLTGLIVAILTTSFANTRAAVTTVVPPTWHYRLVGTTGASIINWWEY